MSDLVDRFGKYIHEGNVTTEELIQIFELVGNYLNIKTISDYCRENKISYNGAKNFRDKVELFGIKFIIDNE